MRRLISAAAAAALCAFGLAAALALTPPGAARADNAPPLTFVLAGQSNMAGWAPLLSPSYPTNRHVTVWTPDGWTVASEPLPAAAGAGPALSFANRVRKQTGRDVRLVECAVGGTPLARWVPSGDLYQRCVDMVHAAGVATVSGVLFFQGESDAMSPELADRWAVGFGWFVAGVRHDFHRKLLPVVYAQLGTPTGTIFPGWNDVKDQQAAYHAAGVAMIRTDDEPQLPDSVHFTVAGYRVIGDRFAASWLALS